MIAYSYDSNGYFIGPYNAQRDQMRAGKFLLPAHATWTAPPHNEDATKEPKWGGSSWSLVQSRTAAAAAAKAAQDEADALAAIAALPTTFRQARDAKIQQVDWMRSRHQDQIFLHLSTTLTDVQYHALLVYIQALRDMPEQNDLNMENPAWPTVPNFVQGE